MDEAIVANMLGPKQISTATLLETIVQNIELALTMFLGECFGEFERDGQQSFGDLEYYSE